MEEDMRQSREAGFLAHLTKPVSLQELEAVLQRVLAAPVAG
jgi:CheY-like chemotaxis protein